MKSTTMLFFVLLFALAVSQHTQLPSRGLLIGDTISSYNKGVVTDNKSRAQQQDAFKGIKAYARVNYAASRGDTVDGGKEGYGRAHDALQSQNYADGSQLTTGARD